MPEDHTESEDNTPQETKPKLPVEVTDTIDKINEALPAVRGLDAGDNEMDELASKASKTFDDLMDLGMNVDSRYAHEIFSVAEVVTPSTAPELLYTQLGRTRGWLRVGCNLDVHEKNLLFLCLTHLSQPEPSKTSPVNFSFSATPKSRQGSIQRHSPSAAYTKHAFG